MTRDEFYTSERHERTLYAESLDDSDVPVPLTKDGFESLCERVTSENDLILDDGIRSIVAGYIHHVPNNEISFNLNELCKVVYKTLSNNMTYGIDQECKLRAKEALKPEGNVIPIKKDDNGPQASS